eukprot:2327595-Rhodomonas_salina.1
MLRSVQADVAAYDLAWHKLLKDDVHSSPYKLCTTPALRYCRDGRFVPSRAQYKTLKRASVSLHDGTSLQTNRALHHRCWMSGADVGCGGTRRLERTWNV